VHHAPPLSLTCSLSYTRTIPLSLTLLHISALVHAALPHCTPPPASDTSQADLSHLSLSLCLLLTHCILHDPAAAPTHCCRSNADLPSPPQLSSDPFSYVTALVLMLLRPIFLRDSSSATSCRAHPPIALPDTLSSTRGAWCHPLCE
jgi:hypothetical protein